MNIAFAYFSDRHDQLKLISKQLGIKYAVSGMPGGRFLQGENSWDLGPLQRLKKSFEDDGITVSVIEGIGPLDKVKLGLPGKDEEIEHFITFLKNLQKVGINTICYNWMPIIGWFRTSGDKVSRGGALVTSFDYELVKDAPYTEAGYVSADDMWKNLEYFLKAVVPVAEETGVRLALHPDDPPIPVLKGISRILINGDAFKRVIEMVPSDYNGITMCQGCFATMGENVPEMIRYFGERKKIFFSHFRDVKGVPTKFEEAFHDDGITDMFEAMKAYYETGFDGVMRPDHVPTMVGEDNFMPGYAIQGNLFAVGYMKGLMESVEKMYKK